MNEPTPQEPRAHDSRYGQTLTAGKSSKAQRPRGPEAQRPRCPVSKHVLLHGGLDRRSAWGWSKVGLPLKASLNGNGEVSPWAGAFGVQ